MTGGRWNTPEVRAANRERVAARRAQRRVDAEAARAAAAETVEARRRAEAYDATYRQVP